MKIGLYQLKYPARKVIEWVLPFVRDVNPNTVSLLMLPVGLVIALCSYAGLKTNSWLLIAAFFLCFLRMFLGTLDGLMAVRFNKSSANGEILNRLAPEFCDAMVLVAIIFAKPEYSVLGTFLLVLAWLTSFSGTLGLFVGRAIQSVGPVGQTDRLAAFMLMILLQYFFPSIDFIYFFMWWCIVGGIITITLRVWRSFNDLA